MLSASWRREAAHLRHRVAFRANKERVRCWQKGAQGSGCVFFFLSCWLDREVSGCEPVLAYCTRACTKQRNLSERGMQRGTRSLPGVVAARPEDNTAKAHVASCLRSRFLRNDTLQAAFLAATRHYICSWPLRGLSRDVEVHVLPLTAEPEADSAILPPEVAGQADFLLDAWQSRASRDSGLHCRTAPLAGPGAAPRLVIGQFWGWHADLGYQRVRHLPQSASLVVRQRACAYYTAMRELMYPSHAAPLKSVGLLMSDQRLKPSAHKRVNSAEESCGVCAGMRASRRPRRQSPMWSACSSSAPPSTQLM